MSSSPLASIPPATRFWMLAIAGATLLQLIVERLAGFPLFGWLAVSPQPSVAWSWQWASQWLVIAPSEPMHRVIDLAVLFFMGPSYERLAGPAATHRAAVAGLVGAGLGIVATIWLTPLASYSDLGVATALMVALAERLGSQPVRFVIGPPMQAWHLVAVFAGIALLNALWSNFAPVAGSFAGSAGAAWLAERVAARSGGSSSSGGGSSGRSGGARPAPKRPAGRRFEVIEGGAGKSDADDKPRYLN